MVLLVGTHTAVKYFNGVFREEGHKNLYFGLIKKVFRSKVTEAIRPTNKFKVVCHLELSQPFTH